MAVREKRMDRITKNIIWQIMLKVILQVAEMIAGVTCSKRVRKFTRRGFAMLLSFITVIASLTIYPMKAEAADTYTVTNAYILEVATGETAGTQIEYFEIQYTGTDNKTHKQFIFPHEDSLVNGYKDVKSYSSDQYIVNTMSAINYGSVNPLPWDKAAIGRGLESKTIDQYYFTTEVGIKSVDKIDGFMGKKGTWTCLRMQLYHVDQLGGLRMAGQYSDTWYIDYEGTLIAEVSSTNNNWNCNDANLMRMTVVNGAKAILKTNFSGVSYAHHELQSKHNYGFRMDFADVYGAGFESLAVEYGDGVKHMNHKECVTETMALTVSYLDIYGHYRFLRLPVILNSMFWAYTGNIEKTSKQDIWGYGQQGESLGFVADIPDCAELGSVSLTVGGIEACAEANIGVIIPNDLTSIQRRRQNDSEKDDIRLTCLAIYDMNNASMSVKVDGAQLSYSFSGNPVLYRTSGDSTGEIYYARNTKNLQLRTYDGKSMEVPNNAEYYLVQIVTDNVSAASTKADLYMTLNYVNSKGKDSSTTEISLSKATADYFGYWPGDSENFVYKWGVNSGNTISALISLTDVDYFTGLKLRMKSPSGGTKLNDDYQFNNLQIYSIKKLGKRKVEWKQQNLNGMNTRVKITREFEGETSTIKILDVDKTVLVQEDQDITVDFESLQVDNIVENTWENDTFRISYEEAMQDFNFTKVRKTYTVTVNVFDDTVATDDQGRVVASGGNGDAGSENLFYFQLIFQDGTSCYELANTQLEGDRFASGSSQSFQIETNQDYGEVTGIRIIPDDTSEDSKKYDKLRIDNIKVTESDVTGTHACWVANDVGWIGVAYTEEQEKNGSGGRKGRTAAEMGKTMTIDYTTNVVQLEVALHTNNQAQGAGYADQLVGQVRGKFTVVLNNGERKELDSFDVVEKMYKYANKRSGANGNAVSDRNTMFRVNHTDRFLVDLDDVKELVALDLYAQADEKPYDWAIGGVSISVITDGGVLRINANDEYEYERDKKPDVLCTHRSEDTPAYLLKVKPSNMSNVNIALTDNEIEVEGEYGKIVSKITRVPASQGDTLNIFVFPTVGSESIVNYELDTTINYAHVYGPIYQTGRRMKTYTAAPGTDERSMFYLIGLQADGMIDLNKIVFKAETDDGKIKNCKLDYAIIQQVRSDVVIANYYVNLGNENAYYGVSKFATTNTEEIGYKDAQMVTFQFGPTTESRMLFADRLDMAVAIRYKLANDPLGKEYLTPYVFLTDQDVLSIEAGQVVDLKFNQMFVGEVTGLRFAMIGDVEATIDGAFVTTARADTTGKPTKTEHYSFANGTIVTQKNPVMLYKTSTGVDDLESIRSVTFGFKTSEAGKNQNSGNDGPVSMVLYTADAYGVVNEPVEINDIRKYMVGGKKNFETDQMQYVRFLVKGASTIRRIEIEPKSADYTGNAGWTLDYATAKLDFGKEDKRTVEERIYEGTPKRITFANVTAKARVYNPNANNDTYKETLVQDSSVKLVVPAEKKFIVSPLIQGSELGCIVTVVEVRDGDYVSNELSNLLKYEASTGNYVFTAPKEEKTKYYRITVASAEIPETKVDISITVVGTEETEPKNTETGTGTGDGSGTGNGGSSGSGESGSGNSGSGESGSGSGSGNSGSGDSGSGNSGSGESGSGSGSGNSGSGDSGSGNSGSGDSGSGEGGTGEGGTGEGGTGESGSGEGGTGEGGSGEGGTGESGSGEGGTGEGGSGEGGAGEGGTGEGGTGEGGSGEGGTGEGGSGEGGTGEGGTGEGGTGEGGTGESGSGEGGAGEGGTGEGGTGEGGTGEGGSGEGSGD